jgi:hypothetical protein
MIASENAMAADKNGRSRADEYRTKAEDCRVQAEQASGDQKRTWLDLAERWSAAADQVEVSLAGLQSEHVQNLFAGGVDGRQEPLMPEIAPNLNPLMRRRRYGVIACGVSALALGLVGAVSLHRTLHRDQPAAGARQTGSGTNTPESVEQTPTRAAGLERAENGLPVVQVRAASEGEPQEVVAGAATNRSSAEQPEDRVERVERPSTVVVASPTAKPVVQDAPGNADPGEELPTPSLAQSQPGAQPAVSAKDKASVKATSKDLPLNTETKAIDANWSVSGRM